MDVEAIRKEVERQVMAYFHMDTKPAPCEGLVTGADVVAHLEHSLLNPDTTLEKIKAECAVARKYSQPHWMGIVLCKSLHIAFGLRFGHSITLPTFSAAPAR